MTSSQLTELTELKGHEERGSSRLLQIISFEACSAFTRVTTCRLAESPCATLYTGGSGGFVASTAAPIATGWSDPVPGRVFIPAVDQRLFTAHCNGLITTVVQGFSGYTFQPVGLSSRSEGIAQ